MAMKEQFMRRFVILLTIASLVLLSGVLFSCKDDDSKTEERVEYDPKKPVELTKFYPDSGFYKEKVLIEGSNFGTDVENIRVYFNNKPAAVIGSTGKRMYVQAPRLPGDTCVISVVVGKDSLSFEKPFFYFQSVSVTTIAGNGQYDYKDGDLADCMLSPRYLCVDKEDNIFVSCRNMPGESWTYEQMAYARIDQEANQLVTIERELIANVPTADPVTGIVTFPTEVTVGSIYTLDPKENWGPRKRELRWKNSSDIPPKGYKHAMSVNPSDGFIYMRYYHGHIVRIDPSNYEAEVIYKTPQGDNFGLTFIPQEPNVLYMSFSSNAGVNANSICSIDVTDPENTFKKLSGAINGGFRDGPLEVAQFKEPNQIMSDSDGNIYVADRGNHCIRRITPDKMVETVLGVPGKSGYKDGGKEEALFNNPTGIGIGTDNSVYVGDCGNKRVRKLSIN